MNIVYIIPYIEWLNTFLNIHKFQSKKAYDKVKYFQLCNDFIKFYSQQ